MSRERNDQGQYTDAVTLPNVLAIFEEVDGPVVTSGDIADRMDCSRDTARRKLQQLESQGIVASRETAGRIIYWRINGSAPNPIDPSDPIFTDRPTFASGRRDLSKNVDELLYGSDA